MASNVTSREVIRDRVYSLLNAGLAGVGNPAQVVFNHTPSEIELEGQTPAVYLASAGIVRDNVAEMNTRKVSTARLFVHVLVSIDENDGLTPAEVEDTLDTIEKTISDIRFDNQVDVGFWEWWGTGGPSQAGYVTIGKEYRSEIMEFTFRFKDN